MREYQVGELVDIAIKGARVEDGGAEGFPCIGVLVPGYVQSEVRALFNGGAR